MLENTRILHAEHSYPTPTRNHLSMHNREAAKRKLMGATRASEVRFGIRTPGGLTVMEAETTSERHARRQEELANLALDRKLRNEAMNAKLTKLAADVDSWAHKS
jgi:hypothetical protein